MENILLLCPNHHKEFDLGNTSIINISDEKVKFLMNDSEYEILLSID